MAIVTQKRLQPVFPEIWTKIFAPIQKELVVWAGSHLQQPLQRRQQKDLQRKVQQRRVLQIIQQMILNFQAQLKISLFPPFLFVQFSYFTCSDLNFNKIVNKVFTYCIFIKSCIQKWLGWFHKNAWVLLLGLLFCYFRKKPPLSKTKRWTDDQILLNLDALRSDMLTFDTLFLIQLSLLKF